MKKARSSVERMGANRNSAELGDSDGAEGLLGVSVG